MKVLISHQGCVPIYRKGFYERLEAISPGAYLVVHAEPPQGSDLLTAKPPFQFSNDQVIAREFRIGKLRLVYHPIVWRALKGEFDGAVIGDEFKFISNLAVAAIMVFRRRPVLLWGFGFHLGKVAESGGEGGRKSRFVTRLRSLVRRLSSGYLAYTEGGRAYLTAHGYPESRIAVLMNTVDTAHQADLRDRVAQEPIEHSYSEFGLPPGIPVLLYFGRFLPSKYVDLLIEYARRSYDRGHPAALILFGDGAEKAKLEAMAAGLPHVVFRSHDDINLTRALRISAAVVIPGFVGLAVTHAFVHGVPVITRDELNHSPEVEYLAHGENGLMLPHDPTAFFDGLDRYLSDADLQRVLHDGCLATSREFDILRMAQRFDGLVRQCLSERTRQAPGFGSMADNQTTPRDR